MATKKIELIFDLDAKDVQFATEKTLSLTEQIRILKKELQKTQEGTKEFEILRNKLNDTKDNFERVNAKSRELFGTLQLIPGPIGEIASKIDGAVSLLKTFSGFSLKDIQNQFKAFGADITGIINNFLGLKESADQVKDGIEGISDTNTKLADSQDSVSTASQNLSNNLTASAVVTNQSAQASQTLTLAQERQFTGAIRLASAEDLLTQAELRQIPAVETDAIAFALKNKIITQTELTSRQAAFAQRELTSATQGETAAAQGATGALVGQAAATETVTLASRAATLAINALKIATGAIVLTALIAGVTYLFGAIKELVTGAKAAAAENERLGKSFELLKRSIDETQKSISEQTKLLKTQAETAGATADEIAEIERKGLQKRIDANKKASETILRETARLAANSILNAEDRQKKLQELETQAVENGRKLADLQAEQRQFEADDLKRKADERRKLIEKEQSDAKQLSDTKRQVREKELEELKQAQKEADLKLLEDRQREETIVNDKYDKLVALAKKYKQDTVDLEKARTKELGEVRTKYDKEERQQRAAELDALIQLEKEKGEEGADTRETILKELLDKRMQLELDELADVENSEAQKLAIRQKYANILKEEISKDEQTKREKRIADLELQLEDDKLTFEQRLDLVKKLEDEIKSNTELNELEKFNLVKGYRDQLLQDLDSSYQAELRITENKYGEFARFTKEYYDEQRAAQAQYQADLDASLAAGTISQEQYNQRNAELGDARIKLNRLEGDSQLEKAGLIGDALGNLSKIVGEDTKAGKAFAIAKATIDTYQSAVAAYKSLSGIPVIGPVLGGIAAAAAVASGIATVKKIVAVQVPEAKNVETGTKPQGTINVNAKMAQGGMVTGPGSGTSDSIPAMLSNGEYVVNARSTSLFQPLLAAINDYGLNTPAFAAGGLAVQQASAPRMDNTERIAEAISLGISNQPIRTYVTSSDVTNQQQFDRVIKSRSLI